VGGYLPWQRRERGKRLSGKTRRGGRWLRQVLIEVAHVAAKTRDTYLAAQYRRIAARHAKKRALVALAHTILVIIYCILTRRAPYRELGRRTSTGGTATTSGTDWSAGWSGSATPSASSQPPPTRVRPRSPDSPF